MKRMVVPLLLLALLLGGCGTRTPEAEAPEAQSVSTAAPDALRDWSEPNAVDDATLSSTIRRHTMRRPATIPASPV